MQKSRVPDISDDISATRLSAGDPWAFRPTLAGGLVLSSIVANRLLLLFLNSVLPATGQGNSDAAAPPGQAGAA